MDFLIILLSAMGGLVIAGFSAPAVGLVDKPDARKVHEGHIPLVGGISIWAAMSVLMLLKPAWLPQQSVFWFCISLLLVVGVVDDRFNLPVLPRVIGQAVAAVLMMHAGLSLNSLGELLPGYVVTLGAVGYLITLIAIWASINAFNMIDGIDGLLGAMTCVTFGALAWLFHVHHRNGPCEWCLALVLALVPYLAANLGLFGGRKCKVFMGDAGSTVIGFAAIWLLVFASQSSQATIAPVTALWLIALPLVDMCAVSLRRLRSGVSPFRPDRGHIHHIIMKCGFSSRETLAILFAASVGCALVGVLFDRFAIPDSLSLLFFIAGFCAWLLFSTRVYRR